MPIQDVQLIFSQFHRDIQLKTILLHDHNFQLGNHCPNEVVKGAPRFHIVFYCIFLIIACNGPCSNIAAQIALIERFKSLLVLLSAF